jgi:hypothetical protein
MYSNADCDLCPRLISERRDRINKYLLLNQNAEEWAVHLLKENDWGLTKAHLCVTAIK